MEAQIKVAVDTQSNYCVKKLSIFIDYLFMVLATDSGFC